MLIIGASATLYPYVRLLRPAVDALFVASHHESPAEIGRSRHVNGYFSLRHLSPPRVIEIWRPRHGRPTAEAVINELLGAIKRHRITHIVAPPDPLVFLLSCHTEEFARAGAKLCAAPFEAVRTIHDKFLFNEMARATGLAAPRSHEVTSVAEAVEVAETHYSYPLVVKAEVSGGSSGVRYAPDHVSMREAVREFLARGVRAALHEYVPGNIEPSVTFLLDAEGEPIVETWLRKVRYAGDGRSCCVATISPPAQAAEIRKFVKQVGLTGFVGLQLKRHAETGELYAIEANPRLGYNSKILMEMWRREGVDVGRLFLQTYEGASAPCRVTRPGMLGVSVIDDLVSAVKTMRGRTSERPDNPRPGLGRLLSSYARTYARRDLVIDVVMRSAITDWPFFLGSWLGLMRGARDANFAFVPWGDIDLPSKPVTSWEMD